MNHNDEVNQQAEEKSADNANDYAFQQRKQSIVDELKWRYAERIDQPKATLREYAYGILRRGVLQEHQVSAVLAALEEPVQVVRRKWDGRPFQI